MLLSLAWLFAFATSGFSIEVCSRSLRKEIRWYYNDAAHTCFATRIDCTFEYAVGIVNLPLFTTEEECTLEHMRNRWITYSMRCPADKRMSVYERSNGDRVPYIFDAAQCGKSGVKGASDFCNDDERCYTHGGFGFCCKVVAYEGRGPNFGIFRFTGAGGARHNVATVTTEMPPPAPSNCNDDGPRGRVEWYRSPADGIGCLVRRTECKHPAFVRTNPEYTFSTMQDCVDFHFPRFTFNYGFMCNAGDAVSMDANGVPLVFSPQLCDGQNDSDFCNADEYCAASKTIANCCKAGASGAAKVRFNIRGKEYMKLAWQQVHPKQ